MQDATTHDLRQRVEALLRPGDIELAGIIVHTDLPRSAEPEMHELTLTVGERIASAAGVEDWYVYSGNDSSEFASNQHQGLTLEEDEFVWECQQLLREGTYDVVLYYEASVNQEKLVDELMAEGHDVTSVPNAG